MTLEQPTPKQIRAAREAAGLTQAQAAELVHAGSYRTWQNWERDAGDAEARAMPLAVWELFKLKSEVKP
jgi:DNA-binding transcriptional regulator YiaG